jgi:protein-arginine kinase
MSSELLEKFSVKRSIRKAATRNQSSLLRNDDTLSMRCNAEDYLRLPGHHDATGRNDLFPFLGSLQ